MIGFPTCRHAKRAAGQPGKRGLDWLAAEPFRVFFASGTLWAIAGVSLWPLFYAGQIGYYPAVVHARIMIEGFGGAFVTGFLGTAGPRMAGAPKLSLLELLWLFVLHQASGICHLNLHLFWGDVFFIALLSSLLLSLVIRMVRFRHEPLPPQMLLALTGLACGIAGAALMLAPATLSDPPRFRLASLLIYQGLLLPPVLGIGSFLFPRMLGGNFGEPQTSAQERAKLLRASGASALLVSSFFLEAWDNAVAGSGLRAFVAFAYLFAEIRGKPPQPGSLTTGLFWALGLGFTGLILAPFYLGSARVRRTSALYRRIRPPHARGRIPCPLRSLRRSGGIPRQIEVGALSDHPRCPSRHHPRHSGMVAHHDHYPPRLCGLGLGVAGDPLAALAPAAFCHQGRRGLTGHSPSESA